MNFTTSDIIAAVSAIANLGMLFVVMRVKIEVQDIKIWILENFEKKPNITAPPFNRRHK